VPARQRVKLTVIELAVLVLDQAVERADLGRIDGDEVRLALRCLLPVTVDRRLLIEFWYYAGQLPHAGRKPSCRSVLASITTDLRAGGHFPDQETARRRLLAERVIAAAGERDEKSAVQRRHYWAPPRQRPG
jgi:hypothetical protein